jgi:hypothetical protein
MIAIRIIISLASWVSFITAYNTMPAVWQSIPDIKTFSLNYKNQIGLTPYS